MNLFKKRTMDLKKILSVAGISTIALLSGGFWGGYEDISCKDLRKEIVDWTVDQRDINGYELIKIYEPTLVSRTKKRVVCKGIASWNDATESNIQYEVFKDRDGEWMLQFKEIQ